jgi:hypothetical protein
LKRGIWGTNDAQYCEGILPSSILLLFISDWWFIFLCGESSIETRIPKSTWNPLVHGFFLCFNSQEDMGHGSWNWCDRDGKRPLCKYKKNELIKHVNRMETILVVCFSVPANNTKIDEQTHVMVDDGQNAQHLTYSSFYFKVATL